MKVYDFLSLLTLLLFNSNGTLAALRPKHDKVVTCYVASWAVYRPDSGKFGIDNIRPELCTHLVYAFAGLNDTTWTIRSLDPGMDIENGVGNYKRMTQLRQKYPHLNILLAIGGWNEGSQNYSILATSPERRSRFVNSVVNFVREYGFNGFDLDWEYPGSRGGAPEDKQNFVFLVKELKEAFREYNYLLTAAISSNLGTIDSAYDIAELSKYLDYIHVMAYDYHGTWDKKVLPNAPLKSQDRRSVEDTLNYLINRGTPPSKTVLGLPMYGRTFILANKTSTSGESPINQGIVSDGFSGPYTREKGFMGYNEICEELVRNAGNWRSGWDDDSETPYLVNGDRVIVYDNPKSLQAKVKYAMNLNLSGVMIWSIDTDDFSGKCSSLKDSLDPTTNNYPLMRSINVVLGNFNNNENNMGDSNNNNDNNHQHKSSCGRFSYSYVLIILSVITYYA